MACSQLLLMSRMFLTLLCNRYCYWQAVSRWINFVTVTVTVHFPVVYRWHTNNNTCRWGMCYQYKHGGGWLWQCDVSHSQYEWQRRWHWYCWQWRWNCQHSLYSASTWRLHTQHQVWWTAGAKGSVHTTGIFLCLYACKALYCSHHYDHLRHCNMI